MTVKIKMSVLLVLTVLIILHATKGNSAIISNKDLDSK